MALSGALDYFWGENKEAQRFKVGRNSIIGVTIALLVLSIIQTVNDHFDNEKKEAELKSRLEKVQEQNSNLQKSVAILSQDQQSRFNSLLDQQQQVGTQTANQIKGSAGILRSRVDESLSLLNKTHEFGQIRGGRLASHEALTSGKLVV